MDDRYICRELSSEYYRNPLKVLGLDYYKKYSAGEDDFSRKQVWFYTYGDEEIEEEFNTRFVDLLKTVFENPSEHWDRITVLPSHTKNDYNPNLARLVENVAGEVDIDFEKFLKRNHTIHRNHELETVKEKIINLENSLDLTADVEGENVIIVDNITLSGTSMMHAADFLKDNGAENVLALCIGLDSRNDDNDTVFEKSEAEEIRKKIMEKDN